MTMRLLVTGQRRSGTTLVGSLLDAQPNIAVHSDYLHIARIKETSGARSVTDPLTAEQKARTLETFQDDVRRLQGEPPSVDIGAGDFVTLVDFYRSVLEQARPPGTRIVGHKSTHAEEVVEELLKADADLKALFVIRDPRDVVRSNRARMWEASAVTLRNWRRGAATVLRTLSNESLSGRVMVVRFEDVVARPQQVIPRLAEFLGLEDFEMPESLQRHQRAFRDNSSFGDVRGVLDDRAVQRWRSGPRWPAAAAEMWVGDLLGEFDYQRTRQRGVADRFAVALMLVADYCWRMPKRSVKRLGRRLLGRN